MKSYWLALAVLMPACAPTPDSYSVPPQHDHPGGEQVPGYGEFIRSTDAAADSHYVKDVKELEDGSWRWTLEAPEFRFYLYSIENLTFRLDMAIAEATFRDTGPVRMEVSVNGHILDRPVFDRPGDHLYKQVVPAGVIRKGENRVLIRVLNAWQAPDPGVKLGFLLHAVGFVRT